MCIRERSLHWLARRKLSHALLSLSLSCLSRLVCERQLSVCALGRRLSRFRRHYVVLHDCVLPVSESIGLETLLFLILVSLVKVIVSLIVLVLFSLQRTLILVSVLVMSFVLILSFFLFLVMILVVIIIWENGVIKLSRLDYCLAAVRSVQLLNLKVLSISKIFFAF